MYDQSAEAIVKIALVCRKPRQCLSKQNTYPMLINHFFFNAGFCGHYNFLQLVKNNLLVFVWVVV